MFNINNLGAILGDMQKNIKDIESKSKDTVFSATSGGGMVKVSINGVGEVVDLQIDDSLLCDKESMQILLIAAFNDAYKSVEANKKTMALGMLGNLNIN